MLNIKMRMCKVGALHIRISFYGKWTKLFLNVFLPAESFSNHRKILSHRINSSFTYYVVV